MSYGDKQEVVTAAAMQQEAVLAQNDIFKSNNHLKGEANTSGMILKSNKLSKN